jgi:LPXTG-site transpeptidase (sortase) family protein
VSVTFNVPSDYAGPDPIVNTASAAANEPDADPSDNSDDAVTGVGAEVADLSIAKTDSLDPVVAGNTLTYTVRVDNFGPSDAVTVVVTDTLPTGVTFVSSSGCAEDPNGVPTCSLGNIAASASASYTITVDVDPSTSGTITNTATVSSDTADPNAANDLVTEITLVTAEADLSISKSDNLDPVLVNGTLTYTLSVTNIGPSTASGVSVSDTLPATVSFGSATGTGWACSEAAGVVTCTRPTLAVGAAPDITITVTAPGVVGTITNNVSVMSTTNDPVPENNTDSEDTDVLAILPPSISKSFAPNPITAGGVSTLQFTITNSNASTDLIGIAFTDTFPTSPDAMFVAGTPNATTNCGGVFTANPGAAAVFFSGGTVTAGSSCALSVDITAPSGGTYVNTSGNVVSTNGGVGNSATDSLLVSAPIVIDPAVTKTGDPATAQVGDTITFTLNVFNNGAADAVNVVVTDTLPVFLDYVSASAPGATGLPLYNSLLHTVTINYAIVQPLPLDFFTITITTVVNDLGAPPGGTNAVSLTSGSADVDLTNNVDSTQITIIAPAPETGFAPDKISPIPSQPEQLSYAQYGELSIQIPAIGVKTSIVGIPLNENGWDVTWLWNQVGYLDGTAFPGWDGNSVLTSHVYLPNGLPGPFVDLKQLRWGDRIIIESFGVHYLYEVRETALTDPYDPDIMRHEERPWVTLVTCQGYDERSDSYRWRRVVRAVLIRVDPNP